MLDMAKTECGYQAPRIKQTNPFNEPDTIWLPGNGPLTESQQKRVDFETSKIREKFLPKS